MRRLAVSGLIVLVGLLLGDPNVGAAAGASPSRPTLTIGVGHNPVGVAVDPLTNRIYTANNQSNSASVIDGATHAVGSIGVGQNPEAVAVDPLRNKIYVANGSSDTVSVIDGATNHVTAAVGVGQDPDAVAVDARTNTIYVAYGVSDTV
jgi:YVTN family beta-propeller protein